MSSAVHSAAVVPAPISVSTISVSGTVSNDNEIDANFTNTETKTERFAWYTFVSDVDVYLKFGPDGVTGATTSAGFYVPAGQERSYRLSSAKSSHLSVIASGAGTLWYYAS